jgi:hypothetical protein
MDDIKVYDLAFDSAQVHAAMTTSTCLVSGIDDIDAENLRIYPNPCNGVLHVDLPAVHDVLTLDVVNMNGQLLQRMTLNKGEQSVQISLQESLPNGMYIVHLHSATQNIKNWYNAAAISAAAYSTVTLFAKFLG